MDLGLNGKVALVTGAGSPTGFGKGTALTLAREGCNVVVLDMNLEWAKQTESEIKILGRESLALKADITKSSEVNAAVKAILSKFGGIDILVNNAGMATPPKLFVEKTEEEWEPDLNINLKGTLICTKAVLPHMLERRSGKIINISSGVGVFGLPRSTIYSAAKAGIIGFTRALAKEVIRSGVYVNSVSPGMGDTNFLRSSNILKTKETPPEFLKAVTAGIPVGRTTTPQDIGNMVAYLASDVSNDIVGQVFDVDGGYILTTA
jgi:NAD(P)-dependent dehydrogenase (short-subunit alcohol dehydrogenase family)